MSKRVFLYIAFAMLFLLGGCLDLTNANDEQNQHAVNESQAASNNLVSISDYTGEEYGYYATPEADEVINENREEVEAAVKNFFQETYNTEVEVKNITSARNSATVFVESLGEVKFYTYAIVPLNISEKEVLADKVFSEEGQVEKAIRSGIYAVVYKEELNNLDTYLKEFEEKNPVTGMRQEAAESMIGVGYGTPYYYIPILQDSFENIPELYLENPNWSEKQWEDEFEGYEIDPESVFISIHLYMDSPDKEPDQDVLDEIVSDIEQMEDLPRAAYSIYLNDNYINPVTGIGNEDNTIERAYPDEIIKE